MNIRDHSFVIGTSILLLAAIIFAGSLVWYQSSARSGGIMGSSNTVQAPLPFETLKKGEPNPADALPHYSSALPLVNGPITAINGTALTVNSGGKSVEVATNAQTSIFKRGALKDQAAFQKEIADFNAAVRYADPSKSWIFVGPTQEILMPVPLSSLRVGGYVTALPVDGTPSAITAFSVEVL